MTEKTTTEESQSTRKLLNYQAIRSHLESERIFATLDISNWITLVESLLEEGEWLRGKGRNQPACIDCGHIAWRKEGENYFVCVPCEASKQLAIIKGMNAFLTEAMANQEKAINDYINLKLEIKRQEKEIEELQAENAKLRAGS